MDPSDFEKSNAPTEPNGLSSELVDTVRRNSQCLDANGESVSLEQATTSLADTKRLKRRRGRSQTTISMVSGEMRNRAARQTLPIKITTIFTLGILLAMSVGSIGTMRISKWVEVHPQTEYRESFVEPLFGPEAVLACQGRCAGWSGDDFPVCRESCARYSFAIYGRRVTARPLRPDADGEAIIKSCSQYSAPRQRAGSELAWRESAAKFLSVLDVNKQSAFSLQQQYQTLIDTGEQFALPPISLKNWDRDARELLHIGCLRSHQLLTEMAMRESRGFSDEYSLAFYTQLHSTIVETTKFAQKTLTLIELPELQAD